MKDSDEPTMTQTYNRYISITNIFIVRIVETNEDVLSVKRKMLTETGIRPLDILYAGDSNRDLSIYVDFIQDTPQWIEALCSPQYVIKQLYAIEVIDAMDIDWIDHAIYHLGGICRHTQFG